MNRKIDGIIKSSMKKSHSLSSEIKEFESGNYPEEIKGKM